MNGWALFLLIAIVLGIIVGNLLLLKQSAHMELPAAVKQAIAKRKAAEAEATEKEQKKKPTDD